MFCPVHRKQSKHHNEAKMCTGIFCLYAHGLQRKVFEPVKTFVGTKKMKKQKKNTGSALAAESANNSHNAQLGLVMNN